MMLEVRCCCQPKKLLGYLPVPDDARTGTQVRFLLSAAQWTLARWDAVPVFEAAKCIVLPIAEIFVPGVEPHPALKSEETPIETLRRIPGFVENTEEAR